MNFDIDLNPGLQLIESYNDDPIVRVKADAIVREYFTAHGPKLAELVCVATEEWYELDIINPDTGRKRKNPFTHAGYIDGIMSGRFQDREGRFILERKTTDHDLDPASSYWNRLRLNTQLDEYALAYFQKNGVMIDGIIFDVIRQPGISPKDITLADLACIANEGTYCTVQVSKDEQERASRYLFDRESFAARKKDHTKAAKSDPTIGEWKEEPPIQPKESPELFGIRFRAIIARSYTDHFQFRFVPVTQGQVLEWAKELWTLSGIVKDCDTMQFSPRNPSACFTFNRSCEYIDFCTGAENYIEDNGETILNVSNRFETKDITSPNRLSVSRLNVLQTCARKHFFRHVAGIVPIDEPKSEKMYLGRLVHEAIEAIWRFQKQQKISKS